jgi:hypothetical protein
LAQAAKTLTYSKNILPRALLEFCPGADFLGDCALLQKLLPNFAKDNSRLNQIVNKSGRILGLRIA